MSSLAISPRLDVAKKTSKRFSLFRSSSNAQTSSTRRFDPSLDLLYERLDVTSQQKRLRSDEVLVESIAVGLDRWDIEKTWSTANTTSGAGWVPGRAVFGKVLARGEGISKVKKGDLVWGLTTLKKVSL
jgi:NADPH:quinone reductase-like Zn-dependent oxidoreductase